VNEGCDANWDGEVGTFTLCLCDHAGCWFAECVVSVLLIDLVLGVDFFFRPVQDVDQ